MTIDVKGVLEIPTRAESMKDTENKKQGPSRIEDVIERGYVAWATDQAGSWLLRLV
jgi:hypothetical protein